MTDEEYIETLHAGWLFADMVQGIDAAAGYDAAQRALSVGAITDPTLYRKAVSRLEADRDMFAAIATAQKALAKAVAARLAAEGKAPRVTIEPTRVPE